MIIVCSLFSIHCYVRKYCKLLVLYNCLVLIHTLENPAATTSHQFRKGRLLANCDRNTINSVRLSKKTIVGLEVSSDHTWELHLDSTLMSFSYSSLCHYYHKLVLCVVVATTRLLNSNFHNFCCNYFQLCKLLPD